MYLTRQQSRDIDALAVEKFGMASIVLMENAGRGVVDVLLQVDPTLRAGREADTCQVALLCGKGNNGGDGFVIARHLHLRGVSTKVILLSSPDRLQGDARQNYEILRHCEVPIAVLSAEPDLASALDREAGGTAWLVDAMLGTGAEGPPREPYRTAIQWINTQDARRLALDAPSGLDCDTGRPAEVAVQADTTCTFIAPKVGFSQPSAAEFVGEVHVVGIGIPAEWYQDIGTPQG